MSVSPKIRLCSVKINTTDCIGGINLVSPNFAIVRSLELVYLFFELQAIGDNHIVSATFTPSPQQKTNSVLREATLR